MTVFCMTQQVVVRWSKFGRTVEDDDNQIRISHRAVRALHAQRLDPVGCFAQPGSVRENHGNAVEVDNLSQSISGGARNVGNNGSFAFY